MPAYLPRILLLTMTLMGMPLMCGEVGPIPHSPVPGSSGGDVELQPNKLVLGKSRPQTTHFGGYRHAPKPAPAPTKPGHAEQGQD